MPSRCRNRWATHSPAFTLATYVHFLDDDLPNVGFDGLTESGNEGEPRPTETLFRPVGEGGG